MKAYFIALLPDARLHGLIVSLKSDLRVSNPSAYYLGEPPHLTLVAGCYPDERNLRNTFISIASRIKKISITIQGWHTFYDDPLTLGHSLTTQLDAASCDLVRSIQQDVIEKVTDFRDPDRSSARYRQNWNFLSPQRRLSVERFGFPYTGDDLIPHLTIASIPPQMWHTSIDLIKRREFAGEFKLDSIALFEISHAGAPKLIEQIPL